MTQSSKKTMLMIILTVTLSVPTTVAAPLYVGSDFFISGHGMNTTVEVPAMESNDTHTPGLSLPDSLKEVYFPDIRPIPKIDYQPRSDDDDEDPDSKRFIGSIASGFVKGTFNYFKDLESHRRIPTPYPITGPGMKGGKPVPKSNPTDLPRVIADADKQNLKPETHVHRIVPPQFTGPKGQDGFGPKVEPAKTDKGPEKRGYDWYTGIEFIEHPPGGVEPAPEECDKFCATDREILQGHHWMEHKYIENIGPWDDV